MKQMLKESLPTRGGPEWGWRGDPWPPSSGPTMLSASCQTPEAGKMRVSSPMLSPQGIPPSWPACTGQPRWRSAKRSSTKPRWKWSWGRKLDCLVTGPLARCPRHCSFWSPLLSTVSFPPAFCLLTFFRVLVDSIFLKSMKRFNILYNNEKSLIF